MSDPPHKDRQSIPVRREPIPPLTETQKADREATNTLLQHDRMVELIQANISRSAPFRLRPHVIQDLNRISISGIETEAGRWRDTLMQIGGSEHDPPAATDVPR